MEWDDLKCVAALAHGGSVRRAGALLGLHGATVARHIERLEARLGTRLFSRTRQGMTITAAGRRVLDAHTRVVEVLEALERDLRSEVTDATGPVELWLPDALAAGWLVPGLANFALRFAEIDLTVRTLDTVPPLVAGDATAALVVTDSPPDHLVGRALGPLAIAGYRSAAPVAEPPADAAPRFVGPVASAFARAWRAAGRLPDTEGSLHCQDIAAQIAAARAGLGVVLLPCVVGDATAGLVRSAPSASLHAGQVWLLHHPDSRGIVRLQALLGYVRDLWRADRMRLEGHSAGN